MVKLAVVAVLATMLVRFPWFRRILLTEKRDWPDRLVFAASLGVPLTAGVLSRVLAQLRSGRPDALGIVPRRPAGRPLCRRHCRRDDRSARGVRGRRVDRASVRGRLRVSPAAACARSAPRKPSGTSRRCSSPTSTVMSGGSCGASRSTGRSCCSRRPSGSSCCGRRSARAGDHIFYPTS